MYYQLLCSSLLYASVSAGISVEAPEQAPELTALKIRAESNAPYSLQWSPVPQAEEYHVEFAKDPHFSDAGKTSTTLLSFRDRFVVAENTRYYYRVQAINNKGKGPWSNVVSVTITP